MHGAARAESVGGVRSRSARRVVRGDRIADVGVRWRAERYIIRTWANAQRVRMCAKLPEENTPPWQVLS